MGRIIFALKSIALIVTRQDKCCPHCGNDRTQLEQRKHTIWHLRKCPVCCLMFRWPKENVESSYHFYQGVYHEGRVGNVPDAAKLEDLLAVSFAADNLDYSVRIKTVRSTSKGMRVLDYGASWGYGVWQFQKAGFDAVGFEVGFSRAEYGRRNLGVRIETTTSVFAANSFDVIHTAHVLEHVADLKSAFLDFHRLLKPGGVLVIFVPNAGGQSAQTLGTRWGPMVGEKHVNALTAEFFAHNLPVHDLTPRFGSSPYDAPLRAMGDSPALNGEELLVVAERNE
jgi:SAM-dependent methyltransferase